MSVSELSSSNLSMLSIVLNAAGYSASMSLPSSAEAKEEVMMLGAKSGKGLVACMIEGSDAASSKMSIRPSNMLPSVALAVNGTSGDASLAGVGKAIDPRGLPALAFTTDLARSQKALCCADGWTGGYRMVFRVDLSVVSVALVGSQTKVPCRGPLADLEEDSLRFVAEDDLELPCESTVKGIPTAAVAGVLGITA